MHGVSPVANLIHGSQINQADPDTVHTWNYGNKLEHIQCTHVHENYTCQIRYDAAVKLRRNI